MGSKRLPRVVDRGSLPQALRLLRTRLDVSQVDLALRTGQNRQRIYCYEKGLNEPSFAGLRKMLDGMGFDLHDLQDALDAVEGRQLQEWPPVSSVEARLRGDAGPGDPETPLLLLFLRFFARLVAEELKIAAPSA